MLRFLNELNSFRKSIEVGGRQPKRSKSRIAHSERHRDRANRTLSDMPQQQQQARPLRDHPSFCCNTQRNVEPPPMVSRKNSKRHRPSKKNSARRQPHTNKQNRQIRIEEDSREPSPQTNKQLVSNSTKVRNEIRARINESYNRNNDYFQKQLVRERFMKTLSSVHRCLRMLPVVNEQCVIGTVGEQMYYFLGRVLFRMVKLRAIDIGLEEFLKLCQPMFEKATLNEIEEIMTATNGIVNVATLGTQTVARTPTVNNTVIFDTENYLIRQATSVSSSTKKTNTNASFVRESNRRQPPPFLDESVRVHTNSHEGKLRRKESYHFDRQQVLEQQSAILKLNDRLEEYIAKHRLRRE